MKPWLITLILVNKYSMKNKISLLFFAILGLNFLNAQFVFNIGGNKYYESKIFFEDGSVKEGLLLDFDDKRVVNFAPQLIAEGFSSPETRFGLTNKYYYFRTQKDSDEEKLLFSDIRRIERKEFAYGSDESRVVVYEKLKLIMYDNKLEKDLEVPEFFAPIQITNGKMNVFSFIESTCTAKSFSSCYVSGLHFYFKPVGSEFGIKPTNFTFSNFMTISNLTNKYYLSFKLLGNDCPDFLKYVNEQEIKNKDSFQSEFVKLVKKIQSKNLTENYKDEFKRKIKKAKKEMKKEAFEKFEGELYQKYVDDSGELFYETLFNEMVIRYINSCE